MLSVEVGAGVTDGATVTRPLQAGRNTTKSKNVDKK